MLYIYIYIYFEEIILYQLATEWYIEIIFIIDHGYMQALSNLWRTK